MPQLTSNVVVFFDGASSSSKSWHNISAPCLVFQRFFIEGSCNSKPAAVSWKLATPTANCMTRSLMLWLWIDTLFVILQFVVITSVPHILFVTICTLETVTNAANMLHMTVSKLLLLLLLSSTLLKNNIILVYCSPRRGILVSPDLKTIYRSTLPRKCKVLIIIVLLLLLLLLLLSLIAQHRLSTRSPKQSDTLVQSCHIPHQSVHGNVYS